MKDMFDRLRLAERKEGSFGIEIEVEGEGLPKRNLPPIWKYERDGSLRGNDNAEYVTREPLSIEGVEKAIADLQAVLEKNNSVVNESVRAGVHVHFNVQRYTPLELLTFLTTYYVLENPLTAFCGKHRTGNHFCLRCVDAPYQINMLIEACKKKDWRHLNTQVIRYSALNLNALFKYGSVEFRAMRSSPNLNDILTWVKLINQVAIGAKKFETPRDVVLGMSELNGPERFVQYVMEDMYHVLPKNVDIMESVRVVQDLAFLVNWDKFDKDKINPFV